ETQSTQRSDLFWSATVFRVDNDAVLNVLKLKPRSGFRYALKEFVDNYGTFDSEVKKASKVPEAQRDLYQARLIELRQHVEEFLKVNQQEIYALPPLTPGGKWESPAEVRREKRGRALSDALKALATRQGVERVEWRER